MSKDKRSVHTDALETLGAIIGAGEKRDAIHIGVEPMIAGEKLSPGEHVALAPGGALGTIPGAGVGIVDPFLMAPVKQGERFWLLVYPRQITSLRHVWEHPDFPASGETDNAPTTVSDKATSEAWMRAWAVEHMGTDYHGDDDKVSPESAYAYAIQAGHTHSVGPYEDARDHIDNEWWGHWEFITSERGDRDEYFSCGC